MSGAARPGPRVKRHRNLDEGWRSWLAACPGYVIIGLIYAPIVWLALMSATSEPLGAFLATLPESGTSGSSAAGSGSIPCG